MPIYSSSVELAPSSPREDDMATRALDIGGVLTSSGGSIRRGAQESAPTQAEALGNALARQRAAFLRDGPPSLDQRRATLGKLRSAMLARKAALTAALEADFGHRSRHETA